MLRTLLFRGASGFWSRNANEFLQMKHKVNKIILIIGIQCRGESKRYKTFIQASIPVSDLQKHSKGVYSMAVDVRVNIKALRMDLEKQGLIRRFGF